MQADSCLQAFFELSHDKKGGKVIAIDRSQKKIDQIQGTCTAMSVSEYVTCHVGDSTKITDPGYNPTFPDGRIIIHLSFENSKNIRNGAQTA